MKQTIVKNPSKPTGNKKWVVYEYKNYYGTKDVAIATPQSMPAKYVTVVYETNDITDANNFVDDWRDVEQAFINAKRIAERKTQAFLKQEQKSKNPVKYLLIDENFKKIKESQNEDVLQREANIRNKKAGKEKYFVMGKSWGNVENPRLLFHKVSSDELAFLRDIRKQLQRGESITKAEREKTHRVIYKAKIQAREDLNLSPQQERQTLNELTELEMLLDKRVYNPLENGKNKHFPETVQSKIEVKEHLLKKASANLRDIQSELKFAKTAREKALINQTVQYYKNLVAELKREKQDIIDGFNFMRNPKFIRSGDRFLSEDKQVIIDDKINKRLIVPSNKSMLDYVRANITTGQIVEAEWKGKTYTHRS